MTVSVNHAVDLRKIELAVGIGYTVSFVHQNFRHPNLLESCR